VLPARVLGSKAGKAARNPGVVPELRALQPNRRGSHAGAVAAATAGASADDDVAAAAAFGADAAAPGAGAAAAKRAAVGAAADAAMAKAVRPAAARCVAAVAALQQGPAVEAYRQRGADAGNAAAVAWAAADAAAKAMPGAAAGDSEDDEDARCLVVRAAVRRAMHAPTVALRQGSAVDQGGAMRAVECAVAEALECHAKQLQKHRRAAAQKMHFCSK